MSQTTTLIIDGDTYIYRAALGAQSSMSFGDNVYAYSADLAAGIRELDSSIKLLMARLRARAVKVVLSDPKANWRKSVLASYKATRSDRPRPILYHQLREHLLQAWGAEWLPTLEGDDLLGLFGTGKSIKGKRIIVSLDKDLQQVPGLLYNPQKPERGVVSITKEAADHYHLTQTLTGDRVDGYEGLPGCGPVCAKKVLAGEGTPWENVVRAFEKKGLSADDALVQARVARILRAGEYSRAEGKVKLWTPPGAEVEQSK